MYHFWPPYREYSEKREWYFYVVFNKFFVLFKEVFCIWSYCSIKYEICIILSESVSFHSLFITRNISLLKTTFLVLLKECILKQTQYEKSFQFWQCLQNLQNAISTNNSVCTFFIFNFTAETFSHYSVI